MMRGNPTGNTVPLRRFTYDADAHPNAWTTEAAWRGTTSWAAEQALQVWNADQTAPMALSPQTILDELEFSDKEDSARTLTLLEDIDGDAIPDLIVLNDQGPLGNFVDHRVFLNRPDQNGVPQFIFNSQNSDALSYIIASLPISKVRFIDLNRDGRTDIAVRAHPFHSGGTVVFLGGRARPGETAGFRMSAPGVAPAHIMVDGPDANRKFADLNGDGAPDLVEQNTWLPNRGDVLFVGPGVPHFFDTRTGYDLSVDDPVIQAASLYQRFAPLLANGSEPPASCMSPGDTAREVISERGLVASDDPDDPSHLDGSLVTPEEWLWRHTSHGDVNGDGYADRLINVTWLRQHEDEWVEDPDCGRTEAVLLGDGTGAFYEVPYATGGPGSTVTQLRTLKIGGLEDQDATARFDLPVNHFSFSDIDGDGRLEALNRCGGPLLTDPIEVLHHRGQGLGFDCGAFQTLTEIPLSWIGPLPLSQQNTTLVDLNGDGFPDGFRGPNPIEDLGTQLTGGDWSSPYPVQQGAVWFRNQRQVHHNRLASVRLPKGGLTTLVWGQSAMYAEDNGPISQPVLRSLSGPDGTYNFEYEGGTFGHGEFLGWEKVTTREPTGAYRVQTNATTLELKGKPWTNEIYFANGALKQMKVFVYDRIDRTNPLPLSVPPFEVGYQRICTFESDEQHGGIAFDRLTLIRHCFEFAEEGNVSVDAFTDDPSQTYVTPDSPIWVWESIPFWLHRLMRYGIDPDQLESWSNLTPAELQLLWELSGVLEGHSLAAITGIPSASHITVAQQDGSAQAMDAYFADQSSAMLGQLGTLNVELMDWSTDTPLTLTVPPVASLPSRYRFYVTEVDWYALHHPSVIRYLRDVSLSDDSRQVAYDYYNPVPGDFDGLRLERMTEGVVGGNPANAERVTVYENTGTHPYQGSRWRERIELTRAGQPVELADHTQVTQRVQRRTFDARGRVMETLPPQGAPTLYAHGFCGLESTTRNERNEVITYDNHCRLVSTVDEVGLTVTHRYDDLQRPLGSVETTPTLEGVLVMDQGTILIDEDGGDAGAGQPASVKVQAHIDGIDTLTRIFEDAWGRVVREQVCEWDRTCPAGLDPLDCPGDLAVAFACKTTAGSPNVVRTFAYDSFGNLSSETAWHEPQETNPSTLSYHYDEFGRQTRVDRPDGSWTETSRSLGSIRHNHSDLRTVRSSLNTLASTTERRNATTGQWQRTSRSIFDRYKRKNLEEDALIQRTTFEYDGLGRLKRVAPPPVDIVECDGTTSSLIPDTITYYDLVDREARVRDPSGHETRTTYDALGRVTRVARAKMSSTGVQQGLEPLRQHAYRLTFLTDSMGAPFPVREVRDIDRLGAITTSWLHSWGEPWKVQHPDGTTARYTYDGRKRRTESRQAYDGKDRVVTLEYDHWDRVVRQVRSFGGAGQPSISHLAYDARGHLVREEDPDGQVTHHEFDALGRETRTRLGADPNTALESSAFTYDLLGRMETQTESGAVTKYEYDGFGRTERVLEGYDGTDGLVTTTSEYDAADRVTAVIDGLGQREERTFDALARVTRIDRKDAQGTIVSSTDFGYDEAGRESRINADGLTSCREYDFLDRVTSERPRGAVEPTLYSYEKSPTHPVTTRVLSGEATTVTSPGGGFIRTYVDAMGRVHLTETPSLLTEEIYDADGRLIREEQRSATNVGPVLRERGYAYEPYSARLQTTTDWVPAGKATVCLNTSGNCPSATQTQTHTLGDRIATSTDGNGNQTTYTYLAGSALLDEVTVQDVTKTKHLYHTQYPFVERQLEGKANPIDVTFVRDRNFRIEKTVRTLAGQPNEETRLDYDALGRVTAEHRYVGTTHESTVTSAYDSRGQLSRRSTQVHAQSGPQMAVDYTYTAAGLLNTATYAGSNNVATYHYVANTARLAQVTVDNPAQPGPAQSVYRVPAGKYEPDGQPNYIQLGPLDGSNQPLADIVRTFDTTTRRLSHQAYTLGTGAHQEQFQETYTFDALGHLNDISRNATAGQGFDVNSSYTFDVRGYVMTEQHQSNPTGNVDGFTYSYDDSGNRDGMTETHGASSTSYQFGYGSPASDRIRTIDTNQSGNPYPLAWDDYGRQLTSSAGHTLSYTLNHELKDVDDAGTVRQSNVYGADGERLSRMSGTQTTFYLSGGDGIVLQSYNAASGAYEDAIAVAGAVIAHVDAQGQVTSIVSGIDGNPVFVEPSGQVNYRPLNAWGMARDGTTAAAGQELSFHQMQHDSTTMLNHAGARVYDPFIGRFLTPDPLGFEGSGSDLYRYAYNNTLSYQDRGGLSPATPYFVDPFIDDPWGDGTGSVQPTGFLREIMGNPLRLRGTRRVDRRAAWDREFEKIERCRQSSCRSFDLSLEPGANETGGDDADEETIQSSRDWEELTEKEREDQRWEEGKKAFKEGKMAFIPMVLLHTLKKLRTVGFCSPSDCPQLWSDEAIEALQTQLPGYATQPFQFTENDLLDAFESSWWILSDADYNQLMFEAGVNDTATQVIVILTIVEATVDLAGLSKVASGLLATRLAKRVGGCFVMGTTVWVPSGVTAIEDITSRDRVLAFVGSDAGPAADSSSQWLHRWAEDWAAESEVDTGRDMAAAASTDGGEEPWVEVEDAPVEASGAWAQRGVCNRVTAWAPKWAMPAMMALAACGVEPELPAADGVVQVYDARTGDWSEATGAELAVGDTWLNDGRLHRWTDEGVEDRGEATVEDLTEADATWTAEAATRVPSTDEWVLVLGEADEAGHWTLGAVEAGERFAFKGRVFETADADGDGLVEVRPTGDVLGRVVNTFVRMAPEVIDAEIAYADGSTDTLTGTPNHPFWVPAIRDYVPLGELEVGIALHVQGGGEAILVSKTWRQGDFEVFDFEVEGLHNFYVRGSGSDAVGVLVHNSTPQKLLPDSRHGQKLLPGPAAGPDGVGRGTERLYRAPRAGGQADQQLQNGLDPGDPAFSAGDQCCYFSRDRRVAEEYAPYGPYDGRILEVEVDGNFFDTQLRALERPYVSTRLGETTEVPIPRGLFQDVNANTLNRTLGDP
ncbi:MAG: RHS repeat-associated core domain-containing protein [Myxococcota bacterium]